MTRATEGASRMRLRNNFPGCALIIACNDSINKSLLGSTTNPNYYYAREKTNSKSNEEDTCVILYSVSKKASFFYTEIDGNKHSYEAKFILKSA